MKWFRKAIETKPIYNACLKSGTAFSLSATDVSTAHDSPFSLYCKYHADPSKRDPPDPFLQALSIKGIEHESDVLESDYTEPPLDDEELGREGWDDADVLIRYSAEIEEAPDLTPEEAFEKALSSMAGGIKALSNFPLFYLPEGMRGYADILVKQDGKSVFGKHHYVIREIKIAKNIKKPHIIQAAFYALMISHIQQRPPEHFYITNGEQDTIQYDYFEYEDLLLESMEQAKRIRGGWMPPAVYGSCNPPWSNHCNDTAIQNRDISLITGIGPAMRTEMINTGFDTIQDIASSSINELQRIKGVGKKKSIDYLESARAINTGKHIRKTGTVNLPKRSTEIFLDMEGLNGMFSDPPIDYLIGALVRTNNTETYHSFIAEDMREDEMLGSFLSFMRGQNDYAVYHWHNYERIHLRSMLDRHGMNAGNLLDTDIMLDLYKIATDAFAFPTYGNGIKDISKWLGFNWRHDNVGATSSMELYQMYVNDPKTNWECMQMIRDYNEDDCIATRVVKDWITTNA